ncbi:hypothetical protein NQ317_005962 [Molorchus minor]|uniref:Uncharacterized protein n=1 Tax=Molorchus minor TaxID=1323400 RepID=A0ABQ9JJI7_9CUCU|nr:hypothetical protein NQ317_005962 [Molorchus minor]
MLDNSVLFIRISYQYKEPSKRKPVMEVLFRISAMLLVISLISSFSTGQNIMNPDEYEEFMARQNASTSTNQTFDVNSTTPEIEDRFLVKIPCKNNFRYIRGECREVYT